MVRARPTRFPAGIEWRLAQPKSTTSHYSSENVLLNRLGLEDFVAHPWANYEGVPDYVAAELRPRSYRRMLLPTLFRLVWYLGERMGRQCLYDDFRVPVDPPWTMFRPPTTAKVLEGRDGEGGDALLVPGASYLSHVSQRLACHRLVLADPADAIQPPDFLLTVLKVDPVVVAFTETLPLCSAEEMDAGIEWPDRIYQVSSACHQRLWQAANCFRVYAWRVSRDTSGPRSDIPYMVGQMETRVTELEAEAAEGRQLLQSRADEISQLKERLARFQSETSAQGEARHRVEREREAKATGAAEEVGEIPETVTLDMLSGMVGSESPTFSLEDLGLDENISEFVIAIGAASRGPP